jgi:flagellin-like protein
MRSKKGLSAIIGTVLLIALVLVAGAIVWTSVKGLVEGKLEGAGSCVDAFEKVNLNAEYTCYGYGASNDVLFSINRRDVEIDSVVVIVSSSGSSKSFEITGTDLDVVDIFNYPNPDGMEKMPGINEGLTYTCTDSTSCRAKTPNSIGLSVIIGSKQCDIVDEIIQIPACSEIGL